MKKSQSFVSVALVGLLVGTALSSPVLAQAVSSPAAEADSQAGAAAGGKISDIRVEGLQRIESGTVLSYLGLKTGDSFSTNAINNGLKNLFATGFFADIKLLRQGNSLIVNVVENPVISKVLFEGNDRIETADLEKEVELKPRSIYARDKVQSDVSRILEIYRRSGRYNATVDPKIIKQDQNRVNLVFEISEGPVARVEKIRFIGNENYDTETLRKAIRTEETAWYKFLSDNDKYDSDRLQFDQELLRRFYTSNGYADFQVRSANAELSEKQDAFYLTFVVEEGPLYNFGEVKVVNELEGPNKPDLGGFITTRKDAGYDASKIESSVDAMTKELGKLGYAFVDIQPKVERDREKKLATLTYVVKPGPRVYVERINVTGNLRTLDEVVRREFRLNEGDPYNSSQLQRTEQRLNNLGFFEKVEVKNEQGSAPDKTIVNVDVKEKSTGEINLGAGFSTVDGVLANFGVSEHNLLGQGQDLRTNFVLAARRKAAELSFTEPFFLDRELSAGFDIFRTYQDFTRQSSYISDVQGINLRISYALQERLQHSLFYTINQNDISDVPGNASAFIRNQEGRNLTSAVGQTLTYDARDNKFNPTKGYFLSLSQEIAGLGGDAKFIKHEAKSSYYYPIAAKWTAGLAGSGGYIHGFGSRGVIINQRFFVGGDDFRGFLPAGIGPRDLSTTDALGGNQYYVGTAELKFPLGLPEELGVTGALFSDAGSLWNSDDTGPTVFDSSTPRVSVGAGVLWSSPFGPIRIDVTQAVKKQDADRLQTFRFSFGNRF
jgi:outer membrane protein insertion porin family